ncbi:MAG: metallophosphoesterase [Phormidesmis sp.]
MKLVSDPAITTKIARMKERVRWQHPLVARHNVDQTRIVLADSQENTARDFSFLVIGDSGTSRHLRDRPQRRVAKRLLEHSDSCDFVLHTGDVVYLTGSSEQYPDNFIKPYREFLVGGDTPNKVRYDKMTFTKPFLPVLGNHDYYDLSLVGGILSKALTPLRRALHKRINLDVGWHGSFQGEGFAKAFLDCLELIGSAQLAGHLEKHYTAKTETGQCLHYVPGKFTRLPNRYYTFRQKGIDFFALDSNTFNAPQPLPKTKTGLEQRKKIESYKQTLEEKVNSLLAESEQLDIDVREQAERANSIYAKVEQFEEQIRDIEKQLNASSVGNAIDREQLNWLRDRLIASWQNKASKGRILFFHHPPYVTEKTKWFQAQTLAVRFHLRQVLDEVHAAIGDFAGDRPLVDLVMSGHAHCFEYLETLETGHGDRNIPWIVCGGSGFSLRRQRKEGNVLAEFGSPIAKCHLFLGRSGHGSHKRRPYSALRVDVQYHPANPDHPQFLLRPLVAERYQDEWTNYEPEPIVAGSISSKPDT